jgi:hypothetical protein
MRSAASAAAERRLPCPSRRTRTLRVESRGAPEVAMRSHRTRTGIPVVFWLGLACALLLGTFAPEAEGW